MVSYDAPHCCRIIEVADVGIVGIGWMLDFWRCLEAVGEIVDDAFENGGGRDRKPEKEVAVETEVWMARVCSSRLGTQHLYGLLGRRAPATPSKFMPTEDDVNDEKEANG